MPAPLTAAQFRCRTGPGEFAVPAEAFRFALPMQFTQNDDRPESGEYAVPFEMLARTAEPVMHWYWGAIYHDFAGMQRGDSIAVDYCHDDGEIIGVGDVFTVDVEGLKIAGRLLSYQANDRVDRLRKLAEQGVPYESSIDFRGDALFEEVPEKFTATVNGRQIAGPALIVREWTLRGVAVCPHGMDARTATQLSAAQQLSQDAPSGVVRIFTKAEMPEATLTPEPAAIKTPPSREALLAEIRQELIRFTGRFGAELGTQWHSEGKTYGEALELFCDHLANSLTAASEEQQKLQDRLTAVGERLGEPTPASGSHDPPLVHSGFADTIRTQVAKLKGEKTSA